MAMEGVAWQRRGSSPFRGVWKRPSGNYGVEITIPRKWRTQKLKRRGHRKWLGTFETAKEAALAYDQMARMYGCSEDKTNFPKKMAFQFDLNFPPPDQV